MDKGINPVFTNNQSLTYLPYSYIFYLKRNIQLKNGFFDLIIYIAYHRV